VVRVPQELGIFLFTTASRPALEPTQPPIQWVKRTRREADHLPPSNAEVKNARSYTFTPQYAFMTWYSEREISRVSRTCNFLFSSLDLSTLMMEAVCSSKTSVNASSIQCFFFLLHLSRISAHLHLVQRSRMRGATPSLPQYALMAWCLVKHRDNFTFSFYHGLVGSVVCFESELTSETVVPFRHFGRTGCLPIARSLPTQGRTPQKNTHVHLCLEHDAVFRDVMKYVVTHTFKMVPFSFYMCVRNNMTATCGGSNFRGTYKELIPFPSI
jgi:hypothetical protein